jgi:serine/threonine protein kinase
MNTHSKASAPPEPLQERAESIFHGALQLDAPHRDSYLSQACGNNPDLRHEVDRLLQAHADAGEFLEQPAAAPDEKTLLTSAAITEKPGTRIGRYKLLQQLGEGGCGMVYMAEQDEPVRRRVALKVIKLGMDTKSVIARFEAERQALALMDHPNIARVLDAGSTETGRPFFVMELVRGIKITEYCDQNKLSTEERLNLFIQVCHAIQHAHQKGIIHRDIKPSNILVTLHDGVPIPKVIDFGIAKATQGRLTDQTLFTAFEQFIGTPAYMSPEQAEMSGLDIDTRCDIYALGVLLYELLTGQTPFDPKELMAAGFDKMRETIREKDPERPSTRLGTMLNADLATTAQHRRSDAPKLVHLIRGDLDWIVMKAIEKDRTRRYETANALALDIQRHLDDEPVSASPPASLYRFQKLIRRNKAAFAALGGILAALVIGLGLALYMFLREREARQRAVAAEQAQIRIRQEVERRAQIGQKMTAAGLMLSRGQIDEASRLINEVNDPLAASIYNVIGNIYARMGKIPDAISHLMRVVEFMPDDHDGYHYLTPLLVQTGDYAAYGRVRAQILQHFADASDPVIAERMAKDSLLLPPAPADWPGINTMVETAITAGPENRFWPYFQFVKGLAEYRQGHFASAIDLMNQVLALRNDPNRTVSAYMVLAMSQQHLNKSAEAQSAFTEGSKLADTAVARTDGGNWNDQMVARIFLREAREQLASSNSAQGAK